MRAAKETDESKVRGDGLKLYYVRLVFRLVTPLALTNYGWKCVPASHGEWKVRNTVVLVP